jgi:hypothetical protein
MFTQMDIRVKTLIDEFLRKGWEFVGSIDIQSDWWFDDILQLNSIWRSVGTQLYLTLLTDPQILDKKTVWCVAISSVVPENRQQFIDQLALNDIKKVNLSAFVENINRSVLNQ